MNPITVLPISDATQRLREDALSGHVRLVDYTVIGDDEVAAFFDAFGQWGKRVKRLSLMWHLSDAQAEMFARTVVRLFNDDDEKPELYGLAILNVESVSGAAALARHAFPLLLEFDLELDYLKDDLFSALFVLDDGSPSLAQCELLHICTDSISMASVRAFADMLPRMQRMHTLDLNGVPIKNEGIAAIATAIANYRELPAVLALRALIGWEAFDLLGTFIGGVPTLRNLHVAPCGISEGGLPAIERALSWSATPLLEILVDGPETGIFERFEKAMKSEARAQRALEVRGCAKLKDGD